jgi:hypothetical protein
MEDIQYSEEYLAKIHQEEFSAVGEETDEDIFFSGIDAMVGTLPLRSTPILAMNNGEIVDQKDLVVNLNAMPTKEDEAKAKQKKMIFIVGVSFLLVVGFLLYKKFKKK